MVGAGQNGRRRARGQAAAFWAGRYLQVPAQRGSTVSWASLLPTQASKETNHGTWQMYSARHQANTATYQYIDTFCPQRWGKKGGKGVVPWLVPCLYLCRACFQHFPAKGAPQRSNPTAKVPPQPSTTDRRSPPWDWRHTPLPLLVMWWSSFIAVPVSSSPPLSRKWFACAGVLHRLTKQELMPSQRAKTHTHKSSKRHPFRPLVLQPISHSHPSPSKIPAERTVCGGAEATHVIGPSRGGGGGGRRPFGHFLITGTRTRQATVRQEMEIK